VDLLGTLQGYVRHRLVAAGATSQLHRLGGLGVHGYRLPGRGGGPPVVLVHGLGGSANGWVRVMQRLARDFSAVHAVDLPGNGFSPLPDSGPLTLEQQVRVLHDYCREVVRTPALVVGNSLGGALSLILGAVHPEDVAALALVAPAGGQMSPGAFSELMQALDVQTTADAVRLTRRLFHRPPLLALLFAPGMKQMHATPAVRALRRTVRESDHIPPELLRGLRAPTLVLWGGSEKLLPQELLAWYRAHLPQARIEVVPGFGHVPQMEHPRKLVNRLRAFAAEAGLLPAARAAGSAHP